MTTPVPSDEEINIAAWPDYILLRIFSLLPLKSVADCGQTCSNWRRIAADSSLWPRRMEFDRFSDVRLVRRLLFIGGGNLEMVSLRLFTDINRMFETLADACCELRALELDHCPSPSDISMESLSRVSDGCKNLECLALRNMTVDEDYVSAFLGVANKFPKLSRIVLYKCFGVTSSAVEAIISELPNLTHLDVEHVRLSPQSLDAIGQKVGGRLKAFYFTTPTIDDVKALRWFEKLEAIGIDVVSPTVRSSHDWVSELSKFRNLRVLRFANVCAPVQVRQLLTRPKVFLKLEHLSFLSCAPMSQNHLCEIMRNHPNLRHLCFDFRLTDPTIQEIADSCQSLTFVYFKVAEEARCSSLQKLDSEHTPRLMYLYVDDSKNIFPELLAPLIKEKPELHVICYGRTFFHHPKDQPTLKRIMNEILLWNPYLDFFPVPEESL